MVNIAEPIFQLFRKKTVPDIAIGDVVRVHQKIKEGDKERVQVFEGIVIAKHGRTSLDATFTVRKIASGVGVERVYLLHSPNIVKVEFKRGSSVRRAKLYYLRKLSGKGLRMKDKLTGKTAWEEVLGEDSTPLEATEADIAEAVEAEAVRQAAEAEVTEQETADTDGATMESAENMPADATNHEADQAGGDQPAEQSATHSTDTSDREGDLANGN